MTAIILSNDKTVNLTDAEKENLTVALASRQKGETLYFTDEKRFCNSGTSDRFIGTEAQVLEMLHEWAYGTWQRDERGIYGTLEEIKANLLDEFLAASQAVKSVVTENKTIYETTESEKGEK